MKTEPLPKPPANAHKLTLEEVNLVAHELWLDRLNSREWLADVTLITHTMVARSVLFRKGDEWTALLAPKKSDDPPAQGVVDIAFAALCHKLHLPYENGVSNIFTEQDINATMWDHAYRIGRALDDGAAARLLARVTA